MRKLSRYHNKKRKEKKIIIPGLLGAVILVAH